MRRKRPGTFEAAGELRRRAETCVQKQHAKSDSVRTRIDAERLVHELRVHQLELEMQNTELQRARDEAEIALERYTDLYDFAPVGYFSIDTDGVILEVNLTGAALLGTERSHLIKRRFQNFLRPTSRPAFVAMLARAHAKVTKEICEVFVQNKAGGFWADVQATSTASPRGPGKCCRLAVSDTTAFKRAEEAQRRMEDLALANQKLQREIIRRREVESALKKAEEHQSRLLERSSQMQEELRHLSHRILKAQEEEHKRISRDLHDHVTQTLVGINVHLAALSQAAAISPKSLKSKIARTQRLVEKSVEIVHRFARELRPPLLDDLGLIPALHSFLKDFTKMTGIRVQFTSFAPGRIRKLDSATSTVLYRLVQEALTNVARHARARCVKIALRKISDAIQIEVADDGRGFDVQRVLSLERHGRLGLLGMRERVQMVGGQYSLKSLPGQGSTICAQIPLHNSRARRHAVPG